MSATSSTTSPSSSDGGGGGGGVPPTSPGVHRGGGEPSSSRRRTAEAVWPEHFVEAVAVQVAVDAARDGGRLAAAPAVAAVFQVCSTWRGVARSELLWLELTRRVWRRGHHPYPQSWRDEFIRLHRTALNFRTGRFTHARLPFPSPSPCRRLALSDLHLAAGFADGSVRLFRLLPAAAAAHAATYGPDPHRDRLGRFSQSISGLFLLRRRLVFASHDGDVHVADIRDPGPADAARRAHGGNLVEDGTLVDFSGDGRRWVGLYAGVPGRAWRVWDGGTEQVLYVGGSLTDPEAVAGWHLLTAEAAWLGRVRMAEGRTAVGCSRARIQAVEVAAEERVGEVLGEVEEAQGIVGADACEGRVAAVDGRGVVRVRRARTLEEVCRLAGRGRGRGRSVCLNWGFAVVVMSGGRIGVWDAASGEYLYSLPENMRVGEGSVVVATDHHLLAWCADTRLLHLWDFLAPPIHLI